MLKLTTFGGLGLRHDDLSVEGSLTQRRRLVLLAVLASEYPTGLSRHALGALLWESADADARSNNLRQAVFALRRGADALGEREEPINGSAEITFNPQGVEADCVEFHRALDANDPAAAIRLYRGQFLAGLEFDDMPAVKTWVEPRRARYAAQFRSVCDAAANNAATEGNWDLALDAWLALWTHDPADPRAIHGLITALVALGRVDEARQYAHAYDASVANGASEPAADGPAAATTLQRALAGEVNVSGGEATRKLYARALLPDSIAGSQTSTGTHRIRSIPRLALIIAPAALALAIVTVVATTFTQHQSASASSVADTSLVMVTPFRIATVNDPSLAYLSEGVVDLLAIKLDGIPGMRATAPDVTLRRLRAAAAGDDLDREQLANVARSLGADRILTGQIIGQKSRLAITATLSNVTGMHRGAEAAVEGPADSVTYLLNLLTARLLAMEAGESGTRLEELTSTSPEALVEFLAGQTAYRRGRYDDAVLHLGRALDADSNFALAGLDLGLAAGWADRIPEKTRGVTRAWAARVHLSPRDQLFLRAFAGPGWPSRPAWLSQVRAAWDSAVVVLPERPEVWYEYGDMLFHGERVLGDATATARSAAAFQHALKLDPTFAPALPHLIQLAEGRGDTAEVNTLTRRYLELDSTGAAGAFARWLASATTGDARTLATVRAAMPDLAPTALRWITMASQFDALDVDDGVRASDVSLSRAAGSDERLEALNIAHDAALNLGHRQLATSRLNDMRQLDVDSHLPLRLRILDAIYSVGDTVSAHSAAVDLADVMAHVIGRTDADHIEHVRDLCVIAQWQLAHGDVNTAAHSALLMGQTPTSLRSAGPAATEACSLLISAEIAMFRDRVAGRTVAARLDSLVRNGPPFPQEVPYLPIAIARLYERVGDRAAALQAITRRYYMTVEALPYLATELREEGRLAAATGDRKDALRAYRMYLTLRASADPDIRDADAPVRAAVDSLLH
jgi:DNA-binding SARP family transcriptional activator/TolB-like protein